MSGLSLYNISEEYRSLLERLFCPETGEVNLEVAQRLDELEQPLQEKAINKVRWMKSLQAEYEAIKLERENMQAREKSLKSKIDWFKQDVLAAMEKSSINEISCPQFVIKLRKNPESVNLSNDVILHSEFLRIKTEPNLQVIKEYLKAGGVIPGATLVHTNSVSIK